MRTYDSRKWKAYKPKLTQLHESRVSRGQCKKCDMPVVPSKAVCAKHEMMFRGHYLKKMYNITLAQYQELWEESNGKCWVCGWTWVAGKRRLSVDHDHKTGLIRGLLCYTCNKGLGVFRDRVDALLGAAAYLQSNWSVHHWQVPGNYANKRTKHTGINKGAF